MTVHIDCPPTKDCKHPEWTYGMICVKCGECGRYDKDFKCVNCGYTEGKKPLEVYANWGSVEFYDVFSVPVCPACRPLFKEEDRANYQDDIEKYGLSFRHKTIPLHIKDFEPRKSDDGNK